MPEFILSGGPGIEAVEAFNHLDAFTRGYIEALFFTETSDPADELAGMTVSDIHPDTLEAIKRDCVRFQVENCDCLALAYEGAYDDTSAGRDFWCTRNGHGVGYWDRLELPQAVQDALTKAAEQWGQTDAYKGDDGFLHLD